MVKAIILVLLATGYVLGLKALNERAMAELATIQEMYTHTDSLVSAALTQGQQIQPASPRP